IGTTEHALHYDARLKLVLGGQAKPADGNECFELARVAVLKQLYATAARFCQDGSAADPKQFQDPEQGLRYLAASAAARAGGGQGKDVAKLDRNERRRLRQQARVWLRAELDAGAKALDGDPAQVAPGLAKALKEWVSDPNLDGVRSPQALSQLSETE